MSTKVTLSIEDYQKDFCKETGINMSKLLREIIDQQIEDLSEEQVETLRRYAGEPAETEATDKVRKELEKLQDAIDRA